MKTKNHIFWCLLILFFSKNLLGQSYSLMDKYWRERYKLVNYYLAVGDGQGESMPADARDHSELMHWGDGALYLGDYIGLLATEYRLLENNGQPVARTLLELHFALDALERLDKNTSLVYPNTTDQLDGCMLRDDIPSNFLQVHPRLQQDDAGNTLPNFWQVQEGEPYYVSTIDPGFDDPGYDMKLISQDHFCHILLGIAFLKKYVENNTYFHITGTDSHGQPVDVYDNLVLRGSEIVNRVTTWAMNGTGTNDWIYADPFGNAPDDLIANHEGRNWGAYSDGIGPAASYITGQTYPPDQGEEWMFQSMQGYPIGTNMRHYNVNNVHQVIVLAAVGDSWRGSMLDGWPNTTAPSIAFQGDYDASNNPDYPANHYGWDKFYGLAYRLLHDKPLDDIDLCSVRDILESCPFSGPFNHQYTPGNYETNGWACTNRWNGNPPEQSGHKENGSGVDRPGNFNGQDFMYLNNLYYLAMQQWEGSRGGVYPQQPYLDWEGEIGNRKYILGAYLKLDNLTVTTVNTHIGDVDAQGTGYVHVTNTTCNQNAFLHISCTTQDNWCIVNGEDYLYDNSWRMLNPNASSNPPPTEYSISPEFENKYEINSISNSPNPVEDQTTISYNILENSPVKITLFDATGRVVQVLMDKPAVDKGSHSLSLDAGKLAPGIYYITMQGNKFSETRKFIKT